MKFFFVFHAIFCYTAIVIWAIRKKSYLRQCLPLSKAFKILLNSLAVCKSITQSSLNDAIVGMQLEQNIENNLT